MNQVEASDIASSVKLPPNTQAVIEHVLDERLRATGKYRVIVETATAPERG